MSGFVYPNELELTWSILIVLYPYITGLVAGAFIVSALYHVFRRDPLEPVSRLALITALSFLVVAPMPLLLHLGQPLRGLEIMWTPNPTSAMAGFGYIYSFYMVVLLLEIWFIFRRDIVQYAQQSRGLAKFGYSVLSLGACDVSESTLRNDDKITRILASIGIPAAAFLHGYVGFIFGAIKANPWWSSPLMPVIFLLSAIVSGMGLLIVLYSILSYFRRQKINRSCILSMNKYLWYFLLGDVTLELLEVVAKMYEARDEWPGIYTLLTEQIAGSFFGIQLLLGALIPLVLLALARKKSLGAAWQVSLTNISGALIVVGVFAMRWNVVIGGQLISKSLVGFTSYQAPFWSMEGVAAVIGLLALPFVIMAVIYQIIPPWGKPVMAVEREQAEVRVAS